MVSLKITYHSEATAGSTFKNPLRKKEALQASWVKAIGSKCAGMARERWWIVLANETLRENSSGWDCSSDTEDLFLLKDMECFGDEDCQAIGFMYLLKKQSSKACWIISEVWPSLQVAIHVPGDPQSPFPDKTGDRAFCGVASFAGGRVSSIQWDMANLSGMACGWFWRNIAASMVKRVDAELPKIDLKVSQCISANRSQGLC